MSPNNSPKLTNNALAVLALANEYCQAIELAASVEPRQFVEKAVRLLPRLYMAVNDLPLCDSCNDEYLLDAVHLDETYYNQVRQYIAALLGEDDTYLDTFEEDMKYSETPIAASISEGLADIFQVLYNLIEDVRHADPDDTMEYLHELRQSFREYWSQTLCNVMRPLNELYQRTDDEDLEEEEPYA